MLPYCFCATSIPQNFCGIPTDATLPCGYNVQLVGSIAKVTNINHSDVDFSVLIIRKQRLGFVSIHDVFGDEGCQALHTARCSVIIGIKNNQKCVTSANAIQRETNVDTANMIVKEKR